MVGILARNVSCSKATRQAKAHIVELVGPAGAGKTTLAHALRARNEKVLLAADLELRRTDHMPIFFGNAPSLLPVLLRRCRDSRWFTWDEIKAMVYLKSWSRVLRQQTMYNDTVVILDHGPVFKLATLHAFGPARLKSPSLEKWWHSIFQQWAFTLDMIIWLDASDTNIVARINTRGQRHAMKGRSEQETSEFLALYRTSYEQILAKFVACGGPKPLRFDTTYASSQQIADELLITCKLT